MPPDTDREWRRPATGTGPLGREPAPTTGERGSFQPGTGSPVRGRGRPGDPAGPWGTSQFADVPRPDRDEATRGRDETIAKTGTTTVALAAEDAVEVREVGDPAEVAG